MYIDISKQLKQLGISRLELAKHIDVTYPTITAIYNGTSSSIKFDILERLCKELGCTPNDILIFGKKELSKYDLLQARFEEDPSQLTIEELIYLHNNTKRNS